MTVHYGDLDINANMLLDLPMTEGIGTTLRDVATPSRLVTLTGAPTWTALASGLMTLNFDGATQYGVCANADSADLGFIAGSYTLLGVFNWTAGGDDSQILIGRYQINVGGWELYLYKTGSMTLRHHHAATTPSGEANPRSAQYSLGWAYGTGWVFGVTRVGNSITFFRDGELVATLGDDIVDPEATNQDLVIGTRYSKNDNFFKNMWYRPRIVGAALTAAQHRTAYELIKEWLP